MPLSSGSRLGPYEILAPIGSGGMGEVYRARDTRLDRTVAVKILPQELAGNAEVRQRFEREARAVSSLNHPHICTLHDIGRQDTTEYLVMEYLEGETLGARLEKGPLSTQDILRYSIEIADALDKAHRHGVVHRDLKPGNIMLTKAGAKLLDFGLAKSTGLASSVASVSNSPTVSQPLTAHGTIVGTFQYMSPEQLEGKEADARTDIFAFGAVIYEMATGRKAFEGQSQASVIAAILGKDPPPITSVQPLAPPTLERAVKICLAKDPDERFQSAHDIKLQLEWIRDAGSQAGVAPQAAAKRNHRERIAWVAAGLLLLATLIAGYFALRPAAPTPSTIRAFIPTPEGTRFNISGDTGGPPTLSLDGKNLAFVAIGSDGLSRIYVRALHELAARPLTGTEGAVFPFWAPDGRAIGFFADSKLKRVDLSGGAALSLADAPGARGGTWSPKGVILFSPNYQDCLYQIPASGGPLKAVTKLNQPTHTTHRWPQFLPDGEHFLYLAVNHADPKGSQSGTYYASLDGKENKVVLGTYSNAVYSMGYLLYMQERTLMAQRFDSASGQTQGEPQPTDETVNFDMTIWRSILTASEAGTLVYGISGDTTGTQLLWLDRAGKQVSLIAENMDFFAVNLSADGKRVAADSQITPNGDIWIYELERGTRTRLTFDIADDTYPVWSPDGTSIFFTSARGDNRYRIYRKLASGAGTEQVVFEGTPHAWPLSFSSDGRYLLFANGDYIGRTKADLWVLPVLGDGKALPLIQDQFLKFDASLSPDGRWVAYGSNESGRNEVYVEPFNPPSAFPVPVQENRDTRRSFKWQISTNGGDRPKWRGDSRELLYVSTDNSIMAVEIIPQGAMLEHGTPQMLFRAGPKPLTASFDVSCDGKHFLINSLGNQGTKPMAVVSNWTANLKK